MKSKLITVSNGTVFVADKISVVSSIEPYADLGAGAFGVFTVGDRDPFLVFSAPKQGRTAEETLKRTQNMRLKFMSDLTEALS